MSYYEKYKKQVLDACQDLTRKGYLVGTGGNVSVRIDGEEALAITPSSMDYLALSEEDICVYSFDKEPLEAVHVPSVEMAMHTAVYRNRPDVNGVVHTHQPYASTFTLINEPIPALFDEQVANLGNRVDLVPYGMSGTAELMENIAARLDNQCNAYILQNHGVLLLGTTLEKAALNVLLLEKVARVYYYAMTSGRPISTLRPESEETIFAMLKSEQRKEVRRKKRLARS
ncbi:MAG: class II aldolase/adducin family protein [Candidatus Promineifilaceae bacterium]|jgi:glutamate-1-semialdehyde 2,1-aminomutase